MNNLSIPLPETDTVEDTDEKSEICIMFKNLKNS